MVAHYIFHPSTIWVRPLFTELGPKKTRLVVLESRLGLKSGDLSGLKSILAGLGLGLGLEGSVSKSFFQSFVFTKYRSVRQLVLGKMHQCIGASKPTCKVRFGGASVSR